MNLQPYLKLMSEQQASDMYFTTGAPVSIRIEGSMRPVGKSMLNPGMTKKLAYDLLTPAQINAIIPSRELISPRIKPELVKTGLLTLLSYQD